MVTEAEDPRIRQEDAVSLHGGLAQRRYGIPKPPDFIALIRLEERSPASSSADCDGLKPIVGSQHLRAVCMTGIQCFLESLASD